MFWMFLFWLVVSLFDLVLQCLLTKEKQEKSHGFYFDHFDENWLVYERASLIWSQSYVKFFRMTRYIHPTRLLAKQLLQRNCESSLCKLSLSPLFTKSIKNQNVPHLSSTFNRTPYHPLVFTRHFQTTNHHRKDVSSLDFRLYITFAIS